jgi:hypothetical protein
MNLSTGLALVLVVASAGCGPKNEQTVPTRNTPAAREDNVEKVVLGSARIGKETAEFYIAYTFDAALLGFSVANASGSGPARYFPLYASTHRGIPPVTLDVFVSESGEEMWIRSSWQDSETLAYRKSGEDTAITPFGQIKYLDRPMPEHLSGGPVPFPPLPKDGAVKKASFRHE